MKLTDAIDLERRIKKDRPDVMTWRMGYRDGVLIMVRRIEREPPGYYPAKKGHPHFIESKEEWDDLRNQI
jgi:hypothetical protein